MSNLPLPIRVLETNTGALYDGHDICPDLSLGQMCFRVKAYNEGIFEYVFHEHVPSHRLSQETANEALRSLVASYSNWPGSFILHSLLNKRAGKPERYPGFTHNVSYPERGVIRHTVDASNAHAWRDTVIDDKNFRQPEQVPSKAKE